MGAGMAGPLAPDALTPSAPPHQGLLLALHGRRYSLYSNLFEVGRGLHCVSAVSPLPSVPLDAGC